ncbi:MAG: hypothetical protein V1772_07510 [Chloroflexota bacterium]
MRQRRDRLPLAPVVGLAALLWVGLIVFMNRRPPEGLNLAFFMAIWGLCVSTTLIPAAYGLNVKLAGWRGPRENMLRAIRQGLLVGMLAIVLMGLRLLQVLSLPTALILTLVVVLIEVLLSLRGWR